MKRGPSLYALYMCQSVSPCIRLHPLPVKGVNIYLRCWGTPFPGLLLYLALTSRKTWLCHCDMANKQNSSSVYWRKSEKKFLLQVPLLCPWLKWGFCYCKSSGFEKRHHDERACCWCPTCAMRVKCETSCRHRNCKRRIHWLCRNSLWVLRFECSSQHD